MKTWFIEGVSSELLLSLVPKPITQQTYKIHCLEFVGGLNETDLIYEILLKPRRLGIEHLPYWMGEYFDCPENKSFLLDGGNTVYWRSHRHEPDLEIIVELLRYHNRFPEVFFSYASVEILDGLCFRDYKRGVIRNKFYTKQELSLLQHECFGLKLIKDYSTIVSLSGVKKELTGVDKDWEGFFND